MKQLTSYTKNGYDFELLTRKGNVGVFCGSPKVGTIKTWEVIIIKSHNGREIAGNYFPPAEFPPSNEEWGSKGWTFSNSIDAMNKFMDVLPHSSSND
jgi:hypothetical protein